LEAVIAEVSCQALRAGLEPEVLEVGHPGRRSGDAECVEIAVAVTAPVLEGNAQLEARPGRADELTFVDPEQPVEGARSRDGGFTDADRADLVGLDEDNLEQRPQLPRQRGGGEPTGGSAAGNHDLLYGLPFQDDPSPFHQRLR